MNSQHKLAGLAIAVVALTGQPMSARPDGAGGCKDFDWPMTSELAWMAASDALPSRAGSELPAPPSKAIEMSLMPERDAVLAAPATGKPKSQPAEPFAGTVTIAAPGELGTYQVTLSGPGWIDVIQEQKALVSVAHTGKSECPLIRKSVRFELSAAPATLQVTSASNKTMRLTIRKLD